MDNNLFNSLPENLILVTEDLKIRLATDNALLLLSVDRASMSVKPLTYLISDFIWEQLPQIKEGGKEKFSTIIFNKSYELTITSFRHSNELLFQFNFISTENLRLSEHEISNSILNTFPGIITLYNCKTGGLAYINESIKKLTGCNREEFLEKGISLIFSLIHPEDAPAIIEKTFKEITKANDEYPAYDDKSIISFDYRMKSNDGNYKWIHSFGLIYQRDSSNQVEYILNFTFDITERKENEFKIQQSEKTLTKRSTTLEEKLKEEKQELIKKEAYYQFMSDAIPGILWTALPSGEMDYYSKRWEETTGMSTEEAIAGAWPNVFHPNDFESSFAAIENSINTGQEYKTEHRIRTKDGSYRWFLSRALPLKDDNGNVIKWFGTSFDIDAEKRILEQLKESRTKYKFLADSIPQFIYTTTPEGVIDYLNKRWYEYSGLPQDDLDIIKIQETVHPEDAAYFANSFGHSIVTGEPFTIEFRLRKHTGEYRWFLGRAIPMKNQNGEIVKWFGSSTDIQEQKEIIEYLAKTEKHLNKTNNELSHKNEELSKINNDLDNFIYTASHDLKAPISNIEGLINFLKSDDFYKAAEVKEVMDLMEKSTERFKKTIAGLTDVAKIQKTFNEDIEEINIEELIKEVLPDISEYNQSNSRIDTDLAVFTFKFPRKNARSILYNLIGNAIKYRSEHRSSVIKITTEDTPDYTILTVEDNGLGIEKENQEKVFKMFKRLHTHIEGTGIGLYIVKRIMDNAGGKIEIDSSPDKGTKFTLYFKKL